MSTLVEAIEDQLAKGRRIAFDTSFAGGAWVIDLREWRDDEYLSVRRLVSDTERKEARLAADELVAYVLESASAELDNAVKPKRDIFIYGDCPECGAHKCPGCAESDVCCSCYFAAYPTVP